MIYTGFKCPGCGEQIEIHGGFKPGAEGAALSIVRCANPLELAFRATVWAFVEKGLVFAAMGEHVTRDTRQTVLPGGCGFAGRVALQMRPEEGEAVRESALSKLLTLAAQLPKGLRSDWRGTNHFELTCDEPDSYWWLGLAEPKRFSGPQAETIAGQRTGLVMDIAEAARRVIDGE